MSANLPSDVGVVSLVKFRCCILKSGVFISQFTFCRSGTFGGYVIYCFMVFKMLFSCSFVLYNVS